MGFVTKKYVSFFLQVRLSCFIWLCCSSMTWGYRMFNKPNSYYQNRNTYLQERRFNQQVRIVRIIMLCPSIGGKSFWTGLKNFGQEKNSSVWDKKLNSYFVCVQNYFYAFKIFYYTTYGYNFFSSCIKA